MLLPELMGASKCFGEVAIHGVRMLLFHLRICSTRIANCSFCEFFAIDLSWCKCHVPSSNLARIRSIHRISPGFAEQAHDDVHTPCRCGSQCGETATFGPLERHQRFLAVV